MKNLTEVLAALNDGKGPDILALAEVEAESTAAECSGFAQQGHQAGCTSVSAHLDEEPARRP